MSRPVGAKIQGCIAFLAALVLCTCLAAVAGSALLCRSAHTVTREAVPLAAATEALRREFLSAQQALFRYLAELRTDTGEVVEHLNRVSDLLEETRRISPRLEAELATIRTDLERYRKVLELLPDLESGGLDWNRRQEYAAAAVTAGTAAEQAAGRLADAAREQVRERSAAAAANATRTWRIALAALLVSGATVLALAYWWKRFQERLLGS